MAADAAGLLDHLEIERAHVVGASMGAMIAQTLAATRPERVISLVSIMGNTGARTSGQPRLRTGRTLMSVPPADRDGYVEHMVKTFTIIGSPGFERDEAELREFAERPSIAAAAPPPAPASSPRSSRRATARSSCARSPRRRS